eukprot:CAMPEP_0172725496 /NCGR_PEP_ID=MMETSP1074-20121228/88516_1 /TAXON_ID=2916 /ORGANISM="Ceratium fusus, Strain PA161109" /LENGTH=394 /DNA_ID=CAMNT_0013552289 /DNA_START=29 /DNA_END=1213 /DNA_ORIENTATION=-
MIVAPPADVAGGAAVTAPPLEASADSSLAAAPADVLASLCQGVQQDMLLAMLGAFHGVAAACAEVCIQRMQLLHLELVQAVEHEVEEAEAKARRDGHSSTAPIFQSIADSLGQKTRLGQLCRQEPCMSERHMTGCGSNATLESMYRSLGGTATPLTTELLKLVVDAGSGAVLAGHERPLHGRPPFSEHTPSPTSESSDRVKRNIPTSMPSGCGAIEKPGKRFVSTPELAEDQRVRPDYCDVTGAGSCQYPQHSASGSSEQLPHSASGSSEQLPQRTQARLQRGNPYEPAAAPGGPHRTTGGAYPESVVAGDPRCDTFFNQRGGHFLPPSTLMPIAGNVPPYLQHIQPGPEPMVVPLIGANQRHGQIREATEHAREKHVREQGQHLAKEQNFFCA